MTEEDLKISELGAYTNNSMNREGLKKLVEKVNSGGGGTVDAYTKAETDALLEDKADADDVYTKAEADALLDDKQDMLTAGTNITIVDNVISASGGGSSEDWEICEDVAEVNNYVLNGRTTNDIVFVLVINNVQYNFFIPKGTAVNRIKFSPIIYTNGPILTLYFPFCKYNTSTYSFTGIQYMYYEVNPTTTDTLTYSGDDTLRNLDIKTTRQGTTSGFANGYNVLVRR